MTYRENRRKKKKEEKETQHLKRYSELVGSDEKVEKFGFSSMGIDTITSDYDDVLAGKSDSVSINAFYTMAPGGTNEKMALDCIRYAIEEILEWTPREAIQKFDSYMLRLMKLERVAEFIAYPVEVGTNDTRYIMSRLYPNRVRISREKLIRDTYEKVLSGTGKQFPREYFNGGEGFRRFCVCLTHLVENYTTISSTEEFYSFFMSAKGKRFLDVQRLRVPADQFAISMLDVIHYVTRNRPDSDMWYAYFTFRKEVARLYREERRQKEAEAAENGGKVQESIEEAEEVEETDSSVGEMEMLMT